MFYLTTHSTHFIYDYLSSDMLNGHPDSGNGNQLPPLHGLHFFNLQQRIFYMHHPTDRISHTTAYLC